MEVVHLGCDQAPRRRLDQVLVIIEREQAALKKVRLFAQRARTFDEGGLLNVAAHAVVADPGEEQDALPGCDVQPSALKGDVHYWPPSAQCARKTTFKVWKCASGAEQIRSIIAWRTSRAGRCFLSAFTVSSSCSIGVCFKISTVGNCASTTDPMRRCFVMAFIFPSPSGELSEHSRSTTVRASSFRARTSNPVTDV